MTELVSDHKLVIFNKMYDVFCLIYELISIDSILIFKPIFRYLYIDFYFFISLYLSICVFKINFFKDPGCLVILSLRSMTFSDLLFQVSILFELLMIDVYLFFKGHMARADLIYSIETYLHSLIII